MSEPLIIFNSVIVWAVLTSEDHLELGRHTVLPPDMLNQLLSPSCLQPERARQCSTIETFILSHQPAPFQKSPRCPGQKGSPPAFTMIFLESQAPSFQGFPERDLEIVPGPGSAGPSRSLLPAGVLHAFHAAERCSQS